MTPNAHWLRSSLKFRELNGPGEKELNDACINRSTPLINRSMPSINRWMLLINWLTPLINGLQQLINWKLQFIAESYVWGSWGGNFVISTQDRPRTLSHEQWSMNDAASTIKSPRLTKGFLAFWAGNYNWTKPENFVLEFLCQDKNQKAQCRNFIMSAQNQTS